MQLALTRSSSCRRGIASGVLRPGSVAAPIAASRSSWLTMGGPDPLPPPARPPGWSHVSRPCCGWVSLPWRREVHRGRNTAMWTGRAVWRYGSVDVWQCGQAHTGGSQAMPCRRSAAETARAPGPSHSRTPHPIRAVPFLPPPSSLHPVQATSRGQAHVTVTYNITGIDLVNLLTEPKATPPHRLCLLLLHGHNFQFNYDRTPNHLP
eukprot:109639-Chlamydomonas_euryale.AAC.1